MSLLSSACARLVVFGSVLVAPLLVLGQFSYLPENGGEFPAVGALPGDQTFPEIAINAAGGYIVWQDNATDEDGLGISARRLNENLTGNLSTFRINKEGKGEQESPKVASLKNGGTVFVWSGGEIGQQHIFARFLDAAGTFITDDVMVNTYINSPQTAPSVAGLLDGNAMVVWSSFDQDGSLQGVYGQRLSPQGQKIGGEFRLNQTTALNQRSPSVTALSSGGFAAVWISESMVGTDANGAESYVVEVWGRLFNASAQPVGNEFRISGAAPLCANPQLANSGDSQVMVAWSQNDRLVRDNGWDIFARCFDETGAFKGDPFRINQHIYGDQFVPKIAALGSDYVVVWTSLGQDGSGEGVFGRFLNSNGGFKDQELQVNTVTVGPQIQPAVASDGVGRFLVAWTTFRGGNESFDLRAQKYLAAGQALNPPSAPFVSALSQTRLSVTWPIPRNDAVSYELFMDDNPSPAVTTNNIWLATRLSPASTHVFKVRYKLADGRVSPFSDPGTGRTWDEDLNNDGLPDDWQAKYWGTAPSQWPSQSADSDGDGATNEQEFLAGTDPTDPSSVLRTHLAISGTRYFLEWNTQPGLVYQVEISADLNAWLPVGGPRFAAGASDQLLVNKDSGQTYYRVIRLR